MPESRTLRIATRGSELALWQARTVAARLEALGTRVTLSLIESEGDANQWDPLARIGGQGVFTKAIDDAVLSGHADMAVHSCKDMPTNLQPGLLLAAVLEREDPGDVLVLAEPATAERVLQDPGYPARIATGSPRRKAFWQQRFPHHEITGLRGNVPTRIDKIRSQGLDGAIFAAAGLIRLGLSQYLHEPLPWLMPAVGQGAVAIACREADAELIALLHQLNHFPTWQRITAERAFLHTLQGGCSAPVAGHAAFTAEGTLQFAGVAFSPDYSQSASVERTVPVAQYTHLGTSAARELLAQHPDAKNWLV
ncbi:MAG: hydroxymethylbilane synthase [Bacteroidetes bacterium]|nr:hydroxymethylbilane synthase [Bacteroidota bacterium]